MQKQIGPAHAGSLAAMILRAEAACARYRLRAEEKGHAPPMIHKRYEMLWSMQAVLERLQAQKVTEDMEVALLKILDASAAVACNDDVNRAMLTRDFA